MNKKQAQGLFIGAIALGGVVCAFLFYQLKEGEPPRSSPYPLAWNAPPLHPNAFAPLPLGSIKPTGWLEHQLRVQAGGLSGHLEEFWPDLGPESGWRGGTGERWERGPYYLDGLVPLAFSLDDAALRTRLKPWLDWVLESQQKSGFFGPQPLPNDPEGAYKALDWWPKMVMLKVLRQYYEATQDPRIIPLMSRYIAFHGSIAERFPLRNWAAFRWQEEVLSILWLYNQTKDPGLLKVAEQVRSQGFDWIQYYEEFPFRKKVGREGISLITHGVNNAMALKTAAVWWQLSGDPSHREGTAAALRRLDEFHGQPNGMFAADEHYAGREPTQGAELCAVVESMFSMEQAFAIIGDPWFGDKLEQIAFNALPGTFSESMWAHQYDQQVNQIRVSVDPRRHWTSNGPDSNIFGLEPFFGCCTANMHQGWPKFTSHLWMATPEGGLAAVAYAPSRVEALVGSGEKVTIIEETEYPFRESIRMTVHLGEMTSFPLVLRIPQWAEGTQVAAGGEQFTPKPGSLLRIERSWRDGDVVEVRFPMRVRVEKQLPYGVSLFRGPILLALDVGEQWVPLRGEPPHNDWEVFATTPWNYALVLDEQVLGSEGHRDLADTVQAAEFPLSEVPFAKGKSPIRVTAPGALVSEWTEVDGSAGPIPQSPVPSATAREPLTLVPYGSTRLRIAVFPWTQR